MTESSLSKGIDLDVRGAGDVRSNTPIDVAMEMVVVVTSIATETLGATIVELMETNANRKQRRRSTRPGQMTDREAHD